MVWVVASACSADAQLPQAHLSWLFPPGAPVGSTNEITLAGTDLDEPRSVVFSDPRVTAAPRTGDPVTFTVVIPAGIPPGMVDARFGGRFGLSNPRTFAIGKGPEITTPATNTTASTAAALPVDTVANSRVPVASAQWYRFEARQGQRLLAWVQARELDSRLVPDLAIFDALGNELATVRRSPLLDFSAATNGVFLLRLNDQTFRGGDDYFYRLLLTAGPHVDFVLPNVLRAGTTNRVVLFGRNLPGGRPSGRSAGDGRPLDRLEIDLAPPQFDAGPSGALDLLRRPAAVAMAPEAFPWAFPAEISTGTSARLLFSLTTNPVASVATLEPVTQPATPTSYPAAPTDPLSPRERDGVRRQTLLPSTAVVPVDPPVEFSGFFPGPGELSGVTFSARKGDVLWIELFAERLNQVCDPWGIVQRVTRDATGADKFSDVLELGDTEANFGGREFDTATRDAAGRFQAPDDGAYRVVVRDLFNRLPEGRRLPYRLSLRRETPDFRLVALPQPQPRLNDNDRQIHLWTTVLRRGETVPLRVIAFRRDGCSSDLDLEVTNLPPGVHATPVRLPAAQNATTVLLTAAEDAPTGSAAIAVVGHARVGDRDLTRSAVFATAIWHVPDWDQERGNSRLAATLPVSVAAEERAPVVLSRIDTEPLSIAAVGKVSFPIAVARQSDFPAAFNVKWTGHPDVEKLKEIAVPEKATNVTVELNLADAPLPPGSYTLWLQGLVGGKYRNNPDALVAAEAALKAAADALQAASPDAKPAAEQKRKAAEAAKKAAEERAKPRDVTLAVYSRPIVVTVTPPPAAEKK